MFLNAVPFILDRMLNFPYFTTATNLFLTGDQTTTNRGLPSRSLISASERTNRDDVKLEVDNPVKTLKFGDGTSKKKWRFCVCSYTPPIVSPVAFLYPSLQTSVWCLSTQCGTETDRPVQIRPSSVHFSFFFYFILGLYHVQPKALQNYLSLCGRQWLTQWWSWRCVRQQTGHVIWLTSWPDYLMLPTEAPETYSPEISTSIKCAHPTFWSHSSGLTP